MSRSSDTSGKTLQNQFRDSADPFGLCFRIPDSTYVMRTKGGGIKMGSRKSLADFFWFVTTRSLRVLLVECKATGEKRIDFSRLEAHQRDALVDFDGLDSCLFGYIAVNVYDAKNVRSDNRLFMIPIATWNELEATLGRKSIPLSVMEEREDIFECPRIPGSMWDMDAFVSSLYGDDIVG